MPNLGLDSVGLLAEARAKEYIAAFTARLLNEAPTAAVRWRLDRQNLIADVWRDDPLPPCRSRRAGLSVWLVDFEECILNPGTRGEQDADRVLRLLAGEPAGEPA